MSQPAPTYSARSASSGIVPRTLNTIRQHHFVIDGPSLGEEITSGETFLVGISSCGVTVMERRAPEMGIPLKRVEIAIDGWQKEDEAFFDHIDMRFTLFGVTPEQGQALLRRYQEL